MRKHLSLILILTLLITIGAATAASAEIKVYINDTKLNFDVPPTQRNGRTLVPLRGIFEGLGATVKWTGSTQTIDAKRPGTDVNLKIGDRTAYVNGQRTTLDVPAMMIRGRTMVPLRFVGEAFGAKVEWKGVTQTIYITDSGAAPETAYKIKYQAHVQNKGWGEWKTDGQVAGTQGQDLRLEAIRIIVHPDYASSVKYQVHVQNKGWTKWYKDQEVAGTVGAKLRIEAIRISLENSKKNVKYKVHMSNKGWGEWVYNGNVAGTTGENRQVEAVRIEITD